MNKFPWAAIPALILGLALGLGYAWVLAPVEIVDSSPASLRADFKDGYRAVIAASYAANGDLPRAQSRLALLGDADAYQALSGQAQRALASGDALQSFQLAQLASALQGLAPAAPAPTSTEAMAQVATSTAETSVPPILPNTSTPFDTSALFPVYTPTPRPTRTPIPPPGAPFKLATQEPICDENLPEGLLQVFAMLTNNRRQIPGVELILSWAGGEERFFTGFKPEIGNGYADAILAPNTLYNLRAADGGATLSDLTPPACQRANGESFWGSIKVILQRD
ncbi:MAG: hypothetical protein HY867_12300 [Chloroflexi bacterium]|nr:hypothetical protein [Chloroflexota bacterium]